MNVLLPIILTLLAGIGVAAQAPTNAMLAKVSGSTLLASLVSFSVGTAAIAIVWAASDRVSPTTLRAAPSWAWLGGIYGAIYVATAAYAAPRLGVATMLMVAIGGQLVAAVVIDHFGLFGLRAEPVSASRIAGLVLVFAGVLLVRR
ncbi:DMT family transporter [Sphingomonas floccifaciens]|uniref:DMT family transporter n=1 Tax=Sphingomonas floccifaciens TaxID=1844115 RepID=A0ABW4NFU5_9SPHN